MLVGDWIDHKVTLFWAIMSVVFVPMEQDHTEVIILLSRLTMRINAIAGGQEYFVISMDHLQAEPLTALL